MPFLAFNLRVRDNGKYAYAENGRNFAIIFEGIESDVPACTID